MLSTTQVACWSQHSMSQTLTTEMPNWWTGMLTMLRVRLGTVHTELVSISGVAKNGYSTRFLASLSPRTHCERTLTRSNTIEISFFETTCILLFCLCFVCILRDCTEKSILWYWYIYPGADPPPPSFLPDKFFLDFLKEFKKIQNLKKNNNKLIRIRIGADITLNFSLKRLTEFSDLDLFLRPRPLKVQYITTKSHTNSWEDL